MPTVPVIKVLVTHRGGASQVRQRGLDEDPAAAHRAGQGGQIARHHHPPVRARLHRRRQEGARAGGGRARRTGWRSRPRSTGLHGLAARVRRAARRSGLVATVNLTNPLWTGRPGRRPGPVHPERSALRLRRPVDAVAGGLPRPDPCCRSDARPGRRRRSRRPCQHLSLAAQGEIAACVGRRSRCSR